MPRKILLLLSIYLSKCNCIQKPHVILVVADDLGWNDIGFHNPDVITPNIDNAAYNGIILNSSYVLPSCSPSRSAIMTGYYPHKTGMDIPVSFFSDWGLPLQFKILPEMLKGLGYGTHIIGKWHLGSCNASYLPTNRGFDSFFGILGAGGHSYTHSYPLSNDDVIIYNSQPQVYDFWNQTAPSLEYNGTYISLPMLKQVENILANRDSNSPLFLYWAFQAPHSPVVDIPPEYVQLYPNEKNPYRKNYSASLTRLDDDFGKLINILKVHGIYNESIIIFMSDNGGEILSGGNNYPLRGDKGTTYEGATRASAFIHSPLLRKTGFAYNGLMHAVDWYSTIIGIAGGKQDLDVDGINLWSEIVNNQSSLRSEFVYKLSLGSNGTLQGAIRNGRWKLIFGNAGTPNTHVKPENVTGEYFYADGGSLKPDPNPKSYFQLYNIDNDPTESNNLASSNADIVYSMYKEVRKYSEDMVGRIYTPNNITKYKDLTTNIKVLNTNWCTAIEKLAPLY